MLGLATYLEVAATCIGEVFLAFLSSGPGGCSRSPLTSCLEQHRLDDLQALVFSGYYQRQEQGKGLEAIHETVPVASGSKDADNRALGPKYN